MSTIFVNGCFDLLHEGHRRFLVAAKFLGMNYQLIDPSFPMEKITWNRLIVALNNDDYARSLKTAKWGAKYPVDNVQTRMNKAHHYADEVVCFGSERQLEEHIEFFSPCIICKGPDYAGKRVTGDDIAPVIILDTPETDEIREFKRKAYML